MREPDIGSEVIGTVPETGDRVQGMYLGGQEVTRRGPTRALLSVEGKRVVVAYDSLEHVEGEPLWRQRGGSKLSPQHAAALRKGMDEIEYPGPNSG